MSYMGKGPHQLESPSIPLILLTGSTYFVKKLNINSESCILIGWLDKIDNGSVKIKSACAGQKPLKTEVLCQKLHSVLSF